MDTLSFRCRGGRQWGLYSNMPAHWPTPVRSISVSVSSCLLTHSFTPATTAPGRAILVFFCCQNPRVRQAFRGTMAVAGQSVLDALLSLALPALVILHLIIAPYTKVEESFNMQATHDVLVYGTPTTDIYHRLSARYDHFDFPGAVPRTFIGPVLLAGLSQPLIYLAGFRHAQLIVRAILGCLNAASLLFFRSRVEKAFGKPTARWYMLLQASQFHVLFYASRTLPNMFAFALSKFPCAPSVSGVRARR